MIGAFMIFQIDRAITFRCAIYADSKIVFWKPLDRSWSTVSGIYGSPHSWASPKPARIQAYSWGSCILDRQH